MYDAPLVPDGHLLHRRLVGRDAIRAEIKVYHQQPTYQGAMNVERSASVLHDTADPDVFMAEIDVAFDEADGRRTTMSLVWIFRLRDGQIASATGRSPCFATTLRSCHPSPPTATRAEPPIPRPELDRLNVLIAA